MVINLTTRINKTTITHFKNSNMNDLANNKYLAKNIDLGLLIIRLAVGGLMLIHGISKLRYGIGPIEGMVEAAGLPTIFASGVYIGEVVAPLLIVLGIATRGAALIMFFNCFVAALMAHTGDLFSLNPMGGWAVELLGLYFFGALALIFTGGGKYAVSTKFIWD